ncbi:hypothetical protein CTheo_7985 [Ceratobasidium theobromae]|uniref:Uncharacterized protein n=1 Tax=Ceratobasidium theobromae TaxID=1582974 RepID=A0A5N5QAY5_9AGAM|nr:hypothetical protein CTheo_7985 [Ceratobasidium theobromae]
MALSPPAKRRAHSPARPSPKRSRSQEDSFLALMLPDMRFEYDDRTLPPIAEDRRAFAFTNTFESPRSPRRPQHARAYSHDMFPVPDMPDFDPFGDSGASSPAFAFGPGFSAYNPQFHPRSHAPLNIQALASGQSSPLADSLPVSPPLESELASVRARIRELEFMNDLLQLRVVELEGEKNKDKDPSPAFEQSWDARTDARVKRFCSLNRAGNALCAWHDSRRERRSFPPRMAPPGRKSLGPIVPRSHPVDLNCGCTYEEALFEESLARHGVGSYHPGESVRMDPALRNPLLKLLQWRYGYKDGDFERDPGSGGWVDGEGEHAWENRPHPPSTSTARRNRNTTTPTAD